MSTTWIQTYSGLQFDPTAPTAEMVNILDIAHALSNLCRYVGHCKFFYSVGEHSLHLSHKVPEELALQALLHDATEAYMCDIPKPFKTCEWFRGYQEMETAVWAVIAAKFELPPCLDPIVREHDHRIAINEREHLFENMQPWPLHAGFEPLPRVKILCAPPPIIANAFMQRFHNLTGGKYAAEQTRIIPVRNDSRILLPK